MAYRPRHGKFTFPGATGKLRDQIRRGWIWRASGSGISAVVVPAREDMVPGQAANTVANFATITNTSNYTSSNGSIVSATFQFDGVDIGAGTDTAAELDSARIRVEDSAGNIKFYTIDNQVTYPISTAANAIAAQDWTIDDETINLDVTGDFTTNGNTLTYVISGLPAGAVDDGDGTISGIATTPAGSGSIVVTATDLAGRETTSTFTFTTTLRTQATLALQNQLFSDDTGDQTYNVASDVTANGNTLTYSLISPPAGVTILGSVITFDTDALSIQSGTSITVRATDEYARQADDTFTLDISDNPLAVLDALFTSGEAGFYYDTTSANNLFTDVGQTTVVTDGDQVASANDGTPNDNDAEQGTAGSRPTWDEATKALDFDGTDDVMPTVATGYTTTMTFMAPVRLDGGTTGTILGGGTGTTIYALSYDSASSASPFANAGASAEVYVDGVEIINCTEADLYEALEDGAFHIVEARVFDADTSADWETKFSVGALGDGTLPHNGLIGTYTLTSNTDTALLDAAREALASTYGVTLQNTLTMAQILSQQTKSSFYADTSQGALLMYQTDEPITLADADNDPVGLIYDADQVGPNLTPDLTSFGSGTGFSTTSDTITFTSRAAFQNTDDLSSGIVDGGVYLVEFDHDFSAGDMDLRFGALGSFDLAFSGTGSVSELIVSDGTGIRFRTTAVTTGTITNLSVREATILSQGTSASRPTVDTASGLLTFDGTDDFLEVALATRSSSAYFAQIYDGADTAFIPLSSDDGTAYIGYASDTDVSTTVSALSGTPTFWADAAVQATPSRDDLHTAWATGSKVMIEALFDSSNAAWAAAYVNRSGSIYTAGESGDFILLGDDPGVVLRNRIRKIMGDKHRIADLGYVADADTTAPVLTGTSYDDVAKDLEFTADEAGTFHWATWNSSGATPTLTRYGYWTVPPLETGSQAITAGTDTFTIDYDDIVSASADRLSYGVIDAAGNVSVLEVETTFTP